VLHFLQNADAIAALGLVVIITIVSSQMGKRAIDALLDRSPDFPIERIIESVSALPGVIDSHRVRLRKSGSDTFVDVHVTLDPLMPLREVHQIMDKVEITIQTLIPGADVDVHPEPAGETLVETPLDE
jgi:divalent metal cation (Fe/Co/Zn/Cd) transporter